MNLPRLLIVDDEPNIRFVIERALRSQGYDLTLAADGEDALRLLEISEYDLVLLDLHMEPVGGMEVLRGLRKRYPDTSVIILTAHGSLDSAVEALRLGAFDYLFKPANPMSLRERVQAGLLQRSRVRQQETLISQVKQLRGFLDDLDIPGQQSASGAQIERFIRSDGLILDRSHRSVTLNGRLLELTTSEYQVLLCLVEAAPNPVSAQDLIKAALGYACEAHEARELAKWHIYQLRQKVEATPSQPKYVKTIRHQGYLWAGD